MPQQDITGLLMSILSRQKWGYLMEYTTDAQRMERLRVLMEQAVFQPVIDSEYPLDSAPAAFQRQLQRGKQGKVLIKFSDNPL